MTNVDLSRQYPPKPVRAMAGTALHQKLIADPMWIVEPKRDGDRCLVVVDPKGRVELWNRHGAKTRYPWLDDLRDELAAWELPPGCVLDCELLHEPRPSQDLVVFDVPSAGGTLRQRRKVLRALFEGEDFTHVKLNPWLKKPKAYEHALHRGYEGVVWKRLDSHYRWQPRAGIEIPDWIKMKPARHYET